MHYRIVLELLPLFANGRYKRKARKVFEKKKKKKIRNQSTSMIRSTNSNCITSLTSCQETDPYELPIDHICVASRLYILNFPEKSQCSDAGVCARILPCSDSSSKNPPQKNQTSHFCEQLPFKFHIIKPKQSGHFTNMKSTLPV